MPRARKLAAFLLVAASLACSITVPSFAPLLIGERRDG